MIDPDDEPTEPPDFSDDDEKEFHNDPHPWNEQQEQIDYLERSVGDEIESDYYDDEFDPNDA